MQLGGENLFVSRLRRELRFDLFDILRFLMGLALEPAVFLPQLGEVFPVAQRLLGRSCSRLLLRVLRALTGLPGFGGVLTRGPDGRPQIRVSTFSYGADSSSLA